MRYFAVKNFDKFQHYKDRNPLWIKLYNEVLDDYEFGTLPDAAKAHLFAIWLLASRYQNRIPFDERWISTRINATEHVDLARLETAGFIIAIPGTEPQVVENEGKSAASNALAQRYQNASPEREIERDTLSLRSSVAREARTDFVEWWQSYPNKVGKAAAERSYLKARRKADRQILLDGVERYRRTKPEDRQWCNPATWLNQERWLDEAAPPIGGRPMSRAETRYSTASLAASILTDHHNDNDGVHEGRNGSPLQRSRFGGERGPGPLLLECDLQFTGPDEPEPV